MLSKQDVELIRSTREEVRNNRMHEITIYGVNITGKHPITGEPIDEPYEEIVNAVVTEVSVRTSVERYRHDGIEIRTGDIIVDISLDDMPEDITEESVEKIVYDDIEHTVVAADKLGLGGFNRVEIIGRRTQ